MASKVEIFNRALVKLGASRITDPLDGGKSATTLSALYDVTRDAELAAHPWSFAITRALIPASTTVVPGYARSFPMPAEYLAMVQVGDSYVFYDASSGERAPGGPLFEIEGGAVLTDEPSPLRIRYVQRITNPGLFAPLFVEALACRLAAEGCEAITQSLAKREAAWKERTQAIREAKRCNAIERPPQALPPGSWVRALEGF